MNIVHTTTLKSDKNRSAKKQRPQLKMTQRATSAVVTGLISSILLAISAIHAPLEEIQSAETTRLLLTPTPICSTPPSLDSHMATHASTEPRPHAAMLEPISHSVQLLPPEILILPLATLI